MSGKRSTTGIDHNRISLMYTLNAISHLNKEEFELLKKLRQQTELYPMMKENEANLLPEVQKILDDFHVKSIGEVIQIVEKFELFELYHF